MATRQAQLRQLEHELAGLRRTHHGLAVAERQNLNRIRQVMTRIRKLEPPPPHPVYGSPLIPDVSEWEPWIDWPAAKAGGVLRAIAKATQYRTDFQFTRNWAAMHQLGFVARGAYHYFTEEPGVTQARRLLAAVDAAGGLRNPFRWDPQHGPLGDFLAVDFEQAYADVATTRAELAELVGELHHQVGYRVLLYTGGPFWNSATDGWQNDLGTIIWHSAYVSDERAWLPACLHPKLSHLWQFTDGRLGRQPHQLAGLPPTDLSITVPAP